MKKQCPESSMARLFDFILRYKIFGIASPSLRRVPTWEDFKYYNGGGSWKGGWRENDG